MSERGKHTAGPTKAQAQWLRYMDRNNGRAQISGIRDLEMADRLCEKGLARVHESRPGFYVVTITDAGRSAISAATGASDE